MSKNTNWFRLPIYYKRYPKEILKLARRAGVDPEEIAERDGINTDSFISVSIPRSELKTLFRIEEYPENPAMTLMYFDTGNIELIVEPERKLTARIDRFLKTTPAYEMDEDDDENFPPPTKEELEEMEGDDENT